MDISPDAWSQCPVCDERFGRPATGRPKVYCSKQCRQTEFRRSTRATKLSETDRLQQVEQHLAIGQWQALSSWPAWPQYRCLVCRQRITATAPARVDRYSWDQVAGVYRRLICETCIPEGS